MPFIRKNTIHITTIKQFTKSANTMARTKKAHFIKNYMIRLTRPNSLILKVKKKVMEIQLEHIREFWVSVKKQKRKCVHGQKKYRLVWKGNTSWVTNSCMSITRNFISGCYVLEIFSINTREHSKHRHLYMCSSRKAAQINWFVNKRCLFHIKMNITLKILME